MCIVLDLMPGEMALAILLMLLTITCEFAWVGWGLTLLALLGLLSKSEWLDRLALYIALISSLLNGMTAVIGLITVLWSGCVSAVACLISIWCVHRWPRFASKGY